MKVLILFVDMLRPNRFGLYNNSEFNDIDNFLNSIGGTLYTNCFSPSPDTPRSMASFYTGLSPFENGCDARVKWPGKFLQDDQPTLFDFFIKNKYTLDFFSNPNERQGGLFPPSISNLDIHNHDFDLFKFSKNIKLKNNHLVFISIPDYHWALQDWGYTERGERIAISETYNSISDVFENLDKDDFDHIFLFSDHGFKFGYQSRFEQWYQFLNRDRSNIFMFHRRKGDNKLTFNEKLCSIQDVANTIDEISGKENKFSLFSNKERSHIVIEDHFSIQPPKVNQNVDIWAVITKEEEYIRTLEKGVLIKDNEVISKKIIPFYDEILKKESQFGKYYDEHMKIFQYHELILAQTKFMNGSARPENGIKHNFLRLIQKYKDLIKYRYKNH